MKILNMTDVYSMHLYRDARVDAPAGTNTRVFGGSMFARFTVQVEEWSDRQEAANVTQVQRLAATRRQQPVCVCVWLSSANLQGARVHIET